MFNAILRFSVYHRWLVLLLTGVVGCVGIFSISRLTIDAVPDITNVQVQIFTEVPGYSPLEVEQRITTPLEQMMSGLPGLEYFRSLSRYGLSQLTIIFRDGTDIYFARQLVAQRVQEAQSRLPAGVTSVLGPVATGLGEIFTYSVEADAAAAKPLSEMEIRELQDWVIKPQLRTVPGVVEVNSVGGFSKQFVVAPDLEKLRAHSITLDELLAALAANNASVGAGFIEQNGEQFLVRVPGQVAGVQGLREIVVGVIDGLPLTVGQLAAVDAGADLRTGAATENGREVVLGTVFMIMGGNGRDVSQAVTHRLEEIKKALPEGVVVRTLYNRTDLVNATINTVSRNMIEGALLVMLVLFVMLGSFRAAVITACVIPLSMLITVIGMVKGGVSANLMSLGALDFGLVVDGAVILVENCIRRIALREREISRPLNQEERLSVVYQASSEVRQSTTFGEMIIMVVYVPILALTGIEGKMYHPMALTVLFALCGAFILSLTFIPAAVAVGVARIRAEHEAGWLLRIQAQYQRALAVVFRYPLRLVAVVCLFTFGSLIAGSRLGSEFVPSLDEGDVALHALRVPGTSLSQAVVMQHQLEKEIRRMPEVRDVFAKIGTAEIATDPMPPSVADGFVMLHPRAQWPNPRKTKQQFVHELEELVQSIPGNNYEFTQPIQMRFNELIAGVRSDLAVKIFGDSLEVLLAEAQKIEHILSAIPGAADVKVEQVTGLSTVSVIPRREVLARYGIPVSEVQKLVQISMAGKQAGDIFAGDRRFPVMVRLSEKDRQSLDTLSSLPVVLPPRQAEPTEDISMKSSSISSGAHQAFSINLGDVADISVDQGPNQISREDGKRRVIVTANIRDRDIGSFVQDAQRRIAGEVTLPAGYWIRWGGQYENLLSARSRLMIVVPVVLMVIFLMIYATFRSVRDSLLISTGIPFALTGGVFALWVRGIPFSISAAVGFIALSGVAVLNGLVLVSFINRRIEESGASVEACLEGAVTRLRPVLMTALVASLGFVPMAISLGTGSEVQRPLATVVIGGILSSTLLTLFVLPVLIAWRRGLLRF